MVVKSVQVNKLEKLGLFKLRYWTHVERVSVPDKCPTLAGDLLQGVRASYPKNPKPSKITLLSVHAMAVLSVADL